MLLSEKRGKKILKYFPSLCNFFSSSLIMKHYVLMNFSLLLSLQENWISMNLYLVSFPSSPTFLTHCMLMINGLITARTTNFLFYCVFSKWNSQCEHDENTVFIVEFTNSKHLKYSLKMIEFNKFLIIPTQPKSLLKIIRHEIVSIRMLMMAI